MYKIKVIAPLTNWNKEEGYFVGCYRCKLLSEDSSATWIAFSPENGPEAYKIKLFKTKKQAENKLKFLEQKIKENGFMFNWQLAIEEE